MTNTKERRVIVEEAFDGGIWIQLADEVLVGKPAEAAFAHELARRYNCHDELVEAVRALTGLKIKGHALLDHLQFSDIGRVLSAKIATILAKATEE